MALNRLSPENQMALAQGKMNIEPAYALIKRRSAPRGLQDEPEAKPTTPAFGVAPAYIRTGAVNAASLLAYRITAEEYCSSDDTGAMFAGQNLATFKVT